MTHFFQCCAYGGPFSLPFKNALLILALVAEDTTIGSHLHSTWTAPLDGGLLLGNFTWLLR